MEISSQSIQSIVLCGQIVLLFSLWWWKKPEEILLPGTKDVALLDLCMLYLCQCCYIAVHVYSQMQERFQKFVEWFPEQLQLRMSGQIQGFVKGGAYSSSRSLKQRVWGRNPPKAIGLLYLKMIPTMKFASHIATYSVYSHNIN